MTFKAPQISEAFEAGFLAAGGKPDHEAPDMQAAWEAHIGNFPADPCTPEEFVSDWNTTIATVSALAEKHGLPKPDLIAHPKWLSKMRMDSGMHIADTLVHMGVRVKFATWQQVEALRQI